MRPPLASLEMTAVSKTFDNREVAVSGVSFAVYPGEIFCLLGGSQSGKTAIVDLATGSIAPSAGRVSVCGIEPLSQPIAAKRHLTFASTEGALRPSLSVQRNMTFFAGMAAEPSDPSKEDCLNALRDVGLPDRVIDRPLRSLTPEATLRVWLAIASLKKSRLVLLDEPTRGISTTGARTLPTYLLDLKSRGVGVFVATSDVVFASQVADRLAIIQSGRLTSRRTRDQVLALSLAQIYLDYLGELPPSNQIGSIP